MTTRTGHWSSRPKSGARCYTDRAVPFDCGGSGAWAVAHAFVWSLTRKEEVAMGTEDAVRRLVEPLLTARGLEVFDIELRSGVLRISVDRQDTSVDLDAISNVSEDISRTIDQADPV